MNKAIIILIIFFILIILGVIGYFIYKSYNKSKVQVPCPQNDISNYNIDEKPLKGSDLLQRIFTRFSNFMNRIRESFDLSPGTVTSISSMSPGILYSRGTINPGVSSIQTPPLNGGTNTCTPYPTTVYFPSSQSTISDPCSGYSGSSTRVSKDCYRKLWATVGCGGDPFLIPDKENWNSSQTLDRLRGDVQTWHYYSKVLKNPYHMAYCL